MHNSEASNITHDFIHLRLDGDADGGGGGGGSVAGLADCSRVQGGLSPRLRGAQQLHNMKNACASIY